MTPTQHSPTAANLSELAAAFSAFAAEVSDPEKTKTAEIQPKDQSKPPFAYGYADLAGVLQHVRPLLGKHGLAITQDVQTDDQHVHVTTLLLHKSGESLAFGPLSLPAGGEPKNWGSAVTYARRFALMAALGIAADGDDDARAAGRGATRGRQQTATDRQVAKILDEIERAQISDKSLRADLHRAYELEWPDGSPIEKTLARLTVPQASHLIERAMAEADRRSAATAGGADPDTGEVDAEPPGKDAAAARSAWSDGKPGQQAM